MNQPMGVGSPIPRCHWPRVSVAASRKDKLTIPSSGHQVGVSGAARRSILGLLCLTNSTRVPLSLTALDLEEGMLRLNVQRVAGNRQPVPTAGFGIAASGSEAAPGREPTWGSLRSAGKAARCTKLLTISNSLGQFTQWCGRLVVADDSQSIGQAEDRVPVIGTLSVSEPKAADSGGTVASGNRQPASQFGQRGIVSGNRREQFVGLVFLMAVDGQHDADGQGLPDPNRAEAQ